MEAEFLDPAIICQPAPLWRLASRRVLTGVIAAVDVTS
jgi:hypothetical protein